MEIKLNETRSLKQATYFRELINQANMGFKIQNYCFQANERSKRISFLTHGRLKKRYHELRYNYTWW